ncbi:long-chain-fatty-acid--CoA ligase 4-like [Dermatophagoides pteronyssinus]|uniref:long-chain-fatty-acid--CoA ligase 4-like n=1 Tax=Dermatophagoides pteronyssinus TaxID=6956 RepID=UPI003F66BD7E
MILVIVVKIIIQLYTWITLPIYFLLQQPWKNRYGNDRKRIRTYRKSSTIEMTDIYVRDDNGDYDYPIFEKSTLTEMFDDLIRIYPPDRHCLGYRKILGEQIIDTNSNCKKLEKKYRLSSYKWLTYQDVDQISRNLSQGLLAKGLLKSDRCLIFAETRIEWMICFRALLRLGTPIVTCYANMGHDGVKHGIFETNVQMIITSLNCLPILENVLNSLPSTMKHSVKHIIYMDDYRQPKSLGNFQSEIDISSLSSVGELGKKIREDGKELPYPEPRTDDPLIIMYTSGTTGQPKAALMTQRQIIQSIRALFTIIRNVRDTGAEHTYIAFLPLAHIMELTLEIFLSLFGVRLGYSSPQTLMDRAPGLASGQKSDVCLLKPTIMTTVPLVLERILKQIGEHIQTNSTPLFHQIFDYLIDYKAKWTRRGYQSPLITRFISKKIQEKFGGRLQLILCGGAALDPIVESKIRSALNVKLLAGYGATETTGAIFCQDFFGLDYGFVGAPMGEIYLQLRNWNDGGYTVRDQPNPRGEILVGGDIICIEYFHNSSLTSEAFFTDPDTGIRWFQTGDIGELYPNGFLKIIDRRKDLIKLQNGEYISLGKIEASLKRSRYIENICVYGHIMSDYLVALIVPDRKWLKNLSDDLAKSNNNNIQDLCNDIHIERLIFEDVQQIAKQSGLSRKEIPKRIRLISDVWSVETGILTSAMKMKRNVIEKLYRQQLSDLYSDSNNNLG